MTPQEQLDIYLEMDKNVIETTKKKAHDYAGVDVLSNFKSVSTAAKALGIDVTTPTGYSLFMVMLKIARLTNLLNAGKTPNNESIDDSFLDGINYFKLAFCNYTESKDLNIENSNIELPIGLEEDINNLITKYCEAIGDGDYLEAMALQKTIKDLKKSL